MTRKPLMAGNWKMNLNHVQAVGVLQKLSWSLIDRKYDPEKSEAVVIPAMTTIRTVQTLIDGDRMPIKHGAQDVSQHEDGAYTGEVSAEMLAKLNCSYAVVGHSERRQYHGETDAIVNAKARKALEYKLSPIICVGEALDVRKLGEQVPYTLAQVEDGLQGITASQMADVVIAYEPVWAIGTGEVATPEDAQEVCGAIRGKIAELYSPEVSDGVRILYGGSVKSGNVKQIMAQEDVDGALVGGASMDPDEFSAIIRFYDLPDLV